MFIYVVTAFVAVLAVVLLIKLIIIKKSAREIADALEKKTLEDTNTFIGISSSDKDMKTLATQINKQLSLLYEKRQVYSHGDAELKKAVTNISHDLRTPLTAINGYLDLLKNEEMSEKASQYLDIIRNRTENMNSLTESLFRYSLVTSPETELHKENCDICAMLQESIAENYSLLKESGIEATISIPDKQVMRFTDKAAVIRIFSNILSNAQKYSDGDLDIVLSEDGEIRFSNSAKGLSEIQVQKMFDRFYTVNEARKSTGLGLSIAKTLIGRLDGEIRAEYIDNKLTIIVKM